MSKIVSVLIPTRNRIAPLIKSVDSLMSKCKRHDLIEILIRFDEDDQSIISAKEEFSKYDEYVKLYSGQRFGYLNLHEYYNELYRKSSGQFLFLFNDDCTMITEAWENILVSKDGHENVFSPRIDNSPYYNLFPIVPKSFCDLISHFSLSAHNDTWWEQIGVLIGRLEQIDMHIMHFQDHFNDQTKVDRDKVLGTTNPLFYSDVIQIPLKNDAAKISEYLRKKNTGG